MKVAAIVILTWFGLVTAAAAQGAAAGKSEGPAGSSKGQLSEVRALVHELQGVTEKLRDLMDQYASLVEQKPQRASEDQLAKWSSALERLMKRVEVAHGAVVDASKRMDQAATGKLPTALAKDVANAHNEAEAQRTAAEQALAKNKSKPAKTQAKREPTAPSKPAPELPEDLEN